MADRLDRRGLRPDARGAVRLRLAHEAVLSDPLAALEYGLVIWAAGLQAIAVAVATLSAEGRAGDMGARIRAASLWMIAALALLLACAAVAGTAGTMNLRNVVLAQSNTHIHLALQPAAASVYLVALVLAGHDGPMRALLGPRGAVRNRVEAVLALAAGLLGAILFLGGDAGPALPGWLWLALKTALVLAAVWVTRRRFLALGESARLAIGWAACLVGIVNLAVTVLRAGP